MYPLLNDFLVILAVSLPVTFVFHRLRLPAIIGFLATGIIVGPHGAGLISDMEAVGELAEIGVVLLLFTIGLEFSVRHLLASGRRILIVSLAQVITTIGVITAACWSFGLPASQGIFLGFLISLSSTAIVLKGLSDRGELDTLHGKVTVSILLFQDLCVIPMMLISPSLQSGGIQYALITRQLLLACFMVVGLYFAARYFVPLLLRQTLQVRNRDVFLVTILFICLGTAYLSAQLGLSLAIGAFIAGLVIAESPYNHQILSDILPFRDTFNSIFFISVGMFLNIRTPAAEWLLSTQLVVLIVIVKTILILSILMLAGYNFRISWISALGLAQVGEFSFLLVKGNEALLPDDIYRLFINSSVLTMFLAPFALAVAPGLGIRLQKMFQTKLLWQPEQQSDHIERKHHLIIIGFGLNGKNLSRVVSDIGIPFVVIEQNDHLVREAQKTNVPVLFGDATRKEVLYKAGVESANMIVIAISDASATRHCVAVLRGLNPKVVILARTRYVAEIELLLKLGANIVVPEEFETSIEIFARVLQQYGIPEHLIDQQIAIIRSDAYGMLRGLSLDQERLLKISEMFLKSTVQQLVISAESRAKNKSLRELDLRGKTGALIIAVIRGEQAITNPGADFELGEGDMVVLWGAHQQLSDASELL